MNNADYLFGLGKKEIADFISKLCGVRTPLIELWLEQDRDIKVDDAYIYQYPINIIYAVFDGTPSRWGMPQFAVKFTEDQINGLYAAMDTLTVREREVLRLKFEEFYTLERTGGVFNVSKERVRQIENKAIRKLRHPSRSRYFILGLTECNRIDYEAQNITRTLPSDEVLSQPFDVLNLSVRAHNCLKRTGVVTIQDVLSLSDDDIRKIRNCGPRTANEIIDKRDEYFVATNKLRD